MELTQLREVNERRRTPFDEAVRQTDRQVYDAAGWMPIAEAEQAEPAHRRRRVSRAKRGSQDWKMRRIKQGGEIEIIVGPASLYGFHVLVCLCRKPTAQHRFPNSTQCLGREFRRRSTALTVPVRLCGHVVMCDVSLARHTTITTELPLHHTQDMRRRDPGPPTDRATATTGTAAAQRLGRPRRPAASTAAKEGFGLRENASMAPCCPAALPEAKAGAHA